MTPAARNLMLRVRVLELECQATGQARRMSPRAMNLLIRARILELKFNACLLPPGK